MAAINTGRPSPNPTPSPMDLLLPLSDAVSGASNLFCLVNKKQKKKKQKENPLYLQGLQ